MTYSTNPSDFPVFGNLDKATYQARKIDLLQPLEYFSAKELYINWADIQCSRNRIGCILDMIQKRRVYFHVYHEMDMGELNEASLICFWILKLSPFYNIRNPDQNVNLIYALALFTRAVNYTANKRGVKPNFTIRVMDHLIHDFIFRDLSKEAIMAIAESLIG